MKHVNILGLAALAVALNGPVATGDTPNPKIGTLSYVGSGHAERAPEYATTSITINVQCQKSADAATQALETAAGPLIAAIVKQTPAAQTETDGMTISDVTTSRRPGANISQEYYRNNTAIKVVRKNNCTGKNVAFDAKVPDTFAAVQAITVRSSNLGWLEGLVRTAAKLNAPQAPVTAPRVGVNGPGYALTGATRRAMLVEVDTKAMEDATGANSSHAKDASSLHLANAKLISRSLLSENNPYASPFERYLKGNAASTKGGKPSVKATVPFTYTVYADTEDRLDPKSSVLTKGFDQNYEVTVEKNVDADYGTVNVGIQVACQASAEEAATAIKGASMDVLKRLEAIQGKAAYTETDGIENNEPGVPYSSHNIQAIAYDANGQPSKYFDLCTQEEISWEERDARLKKNGSYAVGRNFGIRSKDFNALRKLVSELSAEYGQSTGAPTDLQVNVSTISTNLTRATRATLEQAVREDANACFLDPKGALAANKQSQGFLCAHLKSVRVGKEQTNQPKLGGGARSFESAMPVAAAAPSDAGPGGSEQEVIVITEVVKEAGQRPLKTLDRTYEFTYEILSHSYTGPLGPATTPMP